MRFEWAGLLVLVMVLSWAGCFYDPDRDKITEEDTQGGTDTADTDDMDASVESDGGGAGDTEPNCLEDPSECSPGYKCCDCMTFLACLTEEAIANMPQGFCTCY